MKRHLVLKASAPDEIEIAVGTEFKKHFKRKDEPFAMTDEHADMLLASSDSFKEVPAKKEAAAKTAKTSASKAKQSTAKTATKKAAKSATGTVAASTTDKADSSAKVEDVAINKTETKIETTEK